MEITKDIRYIGVNDHGVDIFESQYRVPNGMTYNSYCILDEKIAVTDTVSCDFLDVWLDNLTDVLGDKLPDYLIVSHMEPDHSANIANFLTRYPHTVIVATAAAFNMMKNFFGNDYASNRLIVGDGDTLCLGKHKLTFFTAPMIHWPEVMVTYDSTDKVLFSADAFGKFGALDTHEEWTNEARRYYFGIVGKYGAQVQTLLQKLSGIEISLICPLHGPVLKDNIGNYVNFYKTWASYTPESNGTLIAYTSVYGHTKKAAELLAEKLRRNGCPEVVMHDLSRTDLSLAVADAFRLGKLVLATTTYNADIFPFMRTFLTYLTERNFQNRTVAIIENGSWAPVAAKVMKTILANSKDITFAEPIVSIKSAMTDKNFQQIEEVADFLSSGYTAPAEPNDFSALFHIGYGLYVVTSRDGKKDNGLIVNTVTQVTNSPNRIAVTINKTSYSHHVIFKTGVLNVNCLSVDTPFSVFETFGFQSGRNTDKFAGISSERSANGLFFLPQISNALLSLEVERYLDLGTHGMFICRVIEARKLSDTETMTYSYYQNHVKPPRKTEGKKGFICKICGYIYEGDSLPEDFICPICKHGTEDFEPLS